MPADEIARLAALLRESQPCVVLTGAGISTESGIPDFRSPSGMWAEFDPLEYATLGAFRRDPAKVWRFYAPRFELLTEAEPNPAHFALAEFERLGLVRAVVTQNIDLLHERAGSREVVEVHGSIRTSSCLDCSARYRLAEVVPLIEAGDGAPRCTVCGAILKPDVVFFDELLPPEAIDRAYELAGQARLLLVVGTSLEVHPVAELPRTTLDAGGKVAIVNEGATAADRVAFLKLRRKAGEALVAAAAALGRSVRVVPYDPAWPRLYEGEAANVREALGEAVVAVEHIGSTAVSGLAGKPVIDISVGLRRLELDELQIAAMEALGYEYKGVHGLPGRLFFRKGGERRTHHVHVVEWDGEHWHRHRAFRDYLRAHPQEADRYAAEKWRIAGAAADLQEYRERKEPFVDEMFARAWAWYEQRHS